MNTIGIIGGAGPMAGVLLTRKIVEICQREYQCFNDADFPKLVLLSIPFAEMLQPGTEKQDEATVSKQLNEALDFLLRSGATSLAIACNTLHGFLDDANNAPLINLVTETEKIISEGQFSKVLVLGTNTSASKGIYNFDTARWPHHSEQTRIDQLVYRVLKGDTSPRAKAQLKQLVRRLVKQDPQIEAILLGCTELSVLMDGNRGNHLGVEVVDPIEIIARKLCATTFGTQS